MPTTYIQTSHQVHRSKSLDDHTMVLLSEGTSVGRGFTDSRPASDPRRKPTGWLYPTPYERELCKFHSGPSDVSWRQYYGSRYHQYRLTGNLGDLAHSAYHQQAPYPSDNARRSAEVKALLKLKDQRINLGVALGEARETANLLGSTAKTIARSMGQLRRRQFKKAFRTIGADWKSYPQSWLGYQYAVRPLLSDVYGSAEALQKEDLPSWVTTVKGHYNSETSREETHYNGAYSSRVTVHDKAGVFVRLDYHPTNEFMSTVSSLGATNPLEVIWELVPFSFVLDWAVQVGDWLSVMDATLGYEFLSGSYSLRSESFRNAVGVIPPRKAGDPVWDYVRSSSHARNIRVKRVPYASSPIPGVPVVKNPLSLTHMANGLSLLAAAFSGGVPDFARR